MYTYALIDPVDQPFATFKYHCRTGSMSHLHLKETCTYLQSTAQLRQLGITLPGDENVDDIMTASPSRRDRSPISPMGLSPPTREYAAPVRPSFDSPGKAMHPLSIAPPRMHLSPTKSRAESTSSPVKRNLSEQPHQDFLRGIGGLSLADIKGENRSEAFDQREWNTMRVSPVKQRDDFERGTGASVVVRSLSSAVRSLRRRVGSREE